LPSASLLLSAIADLTGWYGSNAAYRVKIFDEGTGAVVWEEEH
jgi:hypothetical protein